jgi:predicted protein tyrosine phosphatase
MKTYCYSHEDFDKTCYENGWNDNNIPDNVAFISIIGTEECLKYYLKSDEKHWFSKSSDTVLNLEFDDISDYTKCWNSHEFLGLSDIQAESIINFIEKNKDKDIFIHCRAGKSRSQAINRFILDFYGYEQGNLLNPCVTWNVHVFSTLKKKLLGLV